MPFPLSHACSTSSEIGVRVEGVNYVTRCPKCSHLRYVGMPHTCPHGGGKLCKHCERTRVVGRNKRNRRLYPTAKEMWESGVSCWRISQELGIGYETVKRWFKRVQSPFRILSAYKHQRLVRRPNQAAAPWRRPIGVTGRPPLAVVIDNTKKE